MNCKPGDLAIQVRAAVPENLGKILTVIRIATKEDCAMYGFCEPLNPCWFTDRLARDCGGKLSPFCYDNQLRPIRDTPGEDESLQWLDVPSTDKVAA